MEIGSLVWDKSMNSIGIIQSVRWDSVSETYKFRIHLNDGATYYSWGGDLELLCK